MATDSVFSERLTKVRKEREIKRQKAADDLGISRASLEYYEKGMRKPDTEMLLKICNYYNVSSDYLLGLSSARSFATEDEHIKTICDYLEIDEFALFNLREQIRDSGFNALLRNRELLELPPLFSDYHNAVREAIDELKKAEKAIKNEENEKAKRHINNYLILESLMDSIEMKIDNAAKMPYYVENMELLDKLHRLRNKKPINEMVYKPNLNDLYETIKYKEE